MRKLYAVLFAVAAVSTIIVAALVLVFPSHEGEMRTDLTIGDYYTLRVNRTVDRTFTIMAIDGDSLTVEMTTNSNGSPVTSTMTKKDYLHSIYASDLSEYVNTDIRAVIQTEYGQHTCTKYQLMLNDYWIDDKNVIYRSYVGGVDMELVSTSLIKK